MKNITLYNIRGQVTAVMSVPEIDVELVTKDQLWVEGISNPMTQYVSNGQITDMPPKPGETYIFDYDTKQWVNDYDVALAKAVEKRNALLWRSDWTQLPDVPLATKAAWAEYRQALRDITDQPGYPYDIVWPTPPQ
jgi:hypothetical protein